MAFNRVNLNTATVQELALVPGVGEGLARAMVQHRQQFGPFRSWAEVQPLVSPEQLNQLMDATTLEPEDVAL
jgi:competence protein ComEA